MIDKWSWKFCDKANIGKVWQHPVSLKQEQLQTECLHLVLSMFTYVYFQDFVIYAQKSSKQVLQKEYITSFIFSKIFSSVPLPWDTSEWVSE